MRFILSILTLLLLSFSTAWAMPLPDAREDLYSRSYDVIVCHWQQSLAWEEVMAVVAPLAVLDTPIIFVSDACLPAQLLRWYNAAGLAARPGPGTARCGVSLYYYSKRTARTNRLNGKAPWEDDSYGAA